MTKASSDFSGVKSDSSCGSNVGDGVAEDDPLALVVAEEVLAPLPEERVRIVELRRVKPDDRRARAARRGRRWRARPRSRRGAARIQATSSAGKNPPRSMALKSSALGNASSVGAAAPVGAQRRQAAVADGQDELRAALVERPGARRPRGCRGGDDLRRGRAGEAAHRATTCADGGPRSMKSPRKTRVSSAVERRGGALEERVEVVEPAVDVAEGEGPRHGAAG